MKVLIREIKDKNIWEDFLVECREKTFLQSWNWGEFNQKMGHKIWRFGIFEKNDLIGTVLTVKVKAKRGTFLLVQHGPCLASRGISNFKFPRLRRSFGEQAISKQIPSPKFQILNTLLKALKKIGQEEKVDFIRMNPLWENSQENQKLFKNFGFKESAMHANAYEATLKLDLLLPEELLFKNMRKTTRYLIRQTLKNKDVAIEKSNSLKNIKEYEKLNKEVAKKQKFVPFSEKHIENEFEIFNQENRSALLFLGKYKDQLAAGALIVFWSGIGFYHQAASNSKYAQFYIPYSILWEAIKEAKKRGCSLFDFWGYVDPKKQPNHPWAGPSLFKMGFGSQSKEYLKTQDFPLSKKYWLIYAFEKVRSIKRGLWR